MSLHVPTGPAAALALLLGATPAPAAAPETLGLAEALAELEAGNPTLAQAEARAREAEAVSRQAAAALLPSLAASGSYTRNNAEARVSIGDLVGRLMPPGAPPPGDLPDDLVIQPLEAFTASAALRVPLLVPHAWAELAAARRVAAAGEASLGATRLQMRAGLVQAASATSALGDVVTAGEQALLTAREHARSAERAVAAGTAARLDLLKAQADVVRRESELTRAEAELARAELALGVLLGRGEAVRITLAELRPAGPETGVEQLVAEALAGRQELLSRQAALEASDYQLAASRWRLAPQLTASLAGFVSDVPYPTGDKHGWRAMVELAWTLYDGGFRYGKADQAEAAVAGAGAALEAQRLAVIQEVRNAAREVELAAHRLRLAEAQRRLGAEAAETAGRSFDAGLAASLDVLDANDRLYLADVGLAEARAHVRISQVAIAVAVGRDLDVGQR